MFKVWFGPGLSYSETGLGGPSYPSLSRAQRGKQAPGPWQGRTWAKSLSVVAGRGTEEEGQRDAKEHEGLRGLPGEGPVQVRSRKGFQLTWSFKFSFLTESPTYKLQSI